MPGASQLLGEAFVEIRPELQKFTGELREGLGHATKQGVEEAEGGLSRLGTFGKAAFIGLAGAAIGFGAATIHAALEGEQATALLRQTVTNAGGDFEKFEGTVGGLSDKFAKFGITNDEVEQSLSRIIGITQKVEGSEKLLAIAADLAAARHIDLQTASQLVARAADGMVGPLKRMGIVIDTNGTKAEVAERALDALQKRFGGAAQSQADTYAGKLKAFGAELHNAEEEIGTALLPVLGKVAGGLGETVGFFEHNKTAAVLLATVIGGPLVIAVGTFLVEESLLVAEKLADFFTTAAIQALYLADALTTDTLVIGVVAAPIAGLAVLAGYLGLQFLHAGQEAKKAGGDMASSVIKSAEATRDASDVIRAELGAIQDKQNELIAAEMRRLKSFDPKASQQSESQYRKLAIENLNDTIIHTDKLGKQYRTNKEEAKKLRDELKKLEEDQKTSTMATQLEVAASKGAADEMGIRSDMVDKLAKKLGIDLAKATDDQLQQIKDLDDRLQIANPHTLALADAIKKLADDTSDAGERAAAFKAALDLIVGAGIPVSSATAAMNEAIGKIGDKEDIAAGKTKAFKTALDLLLGGNIDAERAAIQLGNMFDGLADKLKTNTNSFDINTKAGRENLSSIEDVVTGIRNHAEALQNQGASQDEIRKAYNADTKALRDQLTAAGVSGAEIDKLLARYNLVPGALDKAIGATQGLTTNLDLNTDAGRRNRAMLDDAVTKIRDHIEAMKNQGAQGDELKTAFDKDTQALKDQLTQAGYTKKQIDDLITSYGLVPGSINTVVTADTREAEEAWKNLMAAAQPYLDALAHLSPDQIKGLASSVAVPSFGVGGWVPGAVGQPLAAVVHGGEFVLSAEMVRGLSGLLGAPVRTPAPVPAGVAAGGVNVEQLVVHEARGAYATGVEAARQLRAEVYRMSGR